MANKKYKLTDGNYWATDGIHDFGQNKTQREINAALVQADSDLSGAITNGTLLDGMPQTAMRITANSDLNSYTTAGTYYINSDADAGTITNAPRAASGTLYVINRAAGNYKTQIYISTTSTETMYARNYNNGTWTNWETWYSSDRTNGNIAKVETGSQATQNYSIGDAVVVNGILYNVISIISNGDAFAINSNIKAKPAMDTVLDYGKDHIFTPTLYDYNTYKRDLTNSGYYFKIGKFVIVFIEFTWDANDTINTIVQIRDLPCNVKSGVMYLPQLTDSGASRVIQGDGQRIYIRPNLKTSDMADPSGNMQFVVFGYERNGYPYPN